MPKVSVVIELLSDCQTDEVVKLLSCMDLSDASQHGLKAKIWSQDRVFRKKLGAARYKSIKDLSNQLLQENFNSVEWRVEKESGQLNGLGKVISEIVNNLKVSPTCSHWSATGNVKFPERLREKERMNQHLYEQAIVHRGIDRFPTSLISTFEIELVTEKCEFYSNIMEFLFKNINIQQLSVLLCARVFLMFGGRFLDHSLTRRLLDAKANSEAAVNSIIEFAPLHILDYSLCKHALKVLSQLGRIAYMDKCLKKLPCFERNLGIINLYPFIKEYGIIDVKNAVNELIMKNIK